MRFNFIRKSLPLVLAGVALGFLARFIFGVPDPLEETGRAFKKPIDESLLESELIDAPDFPLDKPGAG